MQLSKAKKKHELEKFLGFVLQVEGMYEGHANQ